MLCRYISCDMCSCHSLRLGTRKYDALSSEQQQRCLYSSAWSFGCGSLLCRQSSISASCKRSSSFVLPGRRT
jgi:hypothetical protein